MSTKRKLTATLGTPHVKPSARVPEKGLDESRTVVSGGGNAVRQIVNGREYISISSDSEEDEDDLEDSSAEEEEDVSMQDTAIAPIPSPEGEDDTVEPSFGDLVRASASEPIDVAGAFADEDGDHPERTQIAAPSGASLGTVLTQALKTSDVQLLESCLHTKDISIIRATIQRLDSPLAGTLLQKLAERLHRRPGRAGSLMVWVQWTLVTHGGYLATQRDLIKKLAQLNKVIDERAKGLQNLLSLKGKLDMLEAQIQLRRSMQRRRVDEDVEDEGVIYVEGEESDEEVKQITNGGYESEISEDMPTTNGAIVDSEDDESSDNDLLDDEAEVTDADSADEDEVDFDDQDSEGDDVESDDEAPPSKMQKVGGATSKRI